MRRRGEAYSKEGRGPGVAGGGVDDEAEPTEADPTTDTHYRADYKMDRGPERNARPPLGRVDPGPLEGVGCPGGPPS